MHCITDGKERLGAEAIAAEEMPMYKHTQGISFIAAISFLQLRDRCLLTPLPNFISRHLFTPLKADHLLDEPRFRTYDRPSPHRPSGPHIALAPYCLGPYITRASILYAPPTMMLSSLWGVRPIKSRSNFNNRGCPGINGRVRYVVHGMHGGRSRDRGTTTAIEVGRVKEVARHVIPEARPGGMDSLRQRKDLAMPR